MPTIATLYRRHILQGLGGAAVGTLLPALPAQAQESLMRPPLMLAGEYHGRFGLADAHVSEKYDGVRAYWDGQRLICLLYTS